MDSKTFADKIEKRRDTPKEIKRRMSIIIEANIDGFNEICWFHQILGMPCYHMKPAFNQMRSFFGFVYSLSFIGLFIASLVTCMFICDEDNSMRYKNKRLNRSQSSQIVQIIFVAIEAYHTVDNDFGLMYARHEFQNFFHFMERIVGKHKISSNEILKRRLKISAWVLIVINIIHAIVEVLFLYPLIVGDINEQIHYHRPHIDIPDKVTLGLTLAMKTIGSIHSKALDTLIIYFTFLLTYYMRAFGLIVKELVETVETHRINSIRLNDNKMEETVIYNMNAMNANLNNNNTKSLRTFDELRQTYIALEDLISKANDCLSPCILLTNTCNIISIFGGIFIAIDIYGQGANVEEEEAFQIFNAIVCIFCVFFGALYGDGIIYETQSALRPLQKIKFNKCKHEDYRSIQTLIDYMDDTKIQCLSGTGFFRLDKRFLYQILSIIIPYMVLLSQKY